MPLNDQLLQIKRTSETTWDVRSLLLVSFATLVQPCENNKELLRMSKLRLTFIFVKLHLFLFLVDLNPSSLQEMCRAVIRNILRNNIIKEYPDLKKTKPSPKKVPKKKSTLRRLVVPLFDTSEESSDDEFLVRSRRITRRQGVDEEEEEVVEENNDNEPTVQVREMMLNYVLDRIRDRRNNALAQRQNNNREARNVDGSANSESKTENAECIAVSITENSEEGAIGNVGENSEVATTSEVIAVIEHNPELREVSFVRNYTINAEIQYFLRVMIRFCVT